GSRADRADRKRKRRAYLAAMRVLRHLRRVLHATCRGARAGRREATRARGRALAHRPPASGDAAAAPPRAFLGLPASSPIVGALGAQERRVARGLSRAQIADRKSVV